MKAGFKPEKLALALKKYKYVIVILCIGMILMLLPAGGNDGEESAQPTASESSFDLDALEMKLAQALSEINGVGEATVVLTLRSGDERILAQDISEGTSKESQTVIVSTSDRGEEPVSIKTIYPEFMGALVICDGAGNSTVKLQILQAVSAITGLSSDRISICQRK